MQGGYGGCACRLWRPRRSFTGGDCLDWAALDSPIRRYTASASNLGRLLATYIPSVTASVNATYSASVLDTVTIGGLILLQPTTDFPIRITSLVVSIQVPNAASQNTFGFNPSLPESLRCFVSFTYLTLFSYPFLLPFLGSIQHHLEPLVESIPVTSQ